MKKLVFLMILIIIGCAQTDTLVPEIRLTQTTHEDTITLCEGSGTMEHSGLDLNHNSVLDENEVDSIDVVCDVVVPPEVPIEEDHGDFHCHKPWHWHCKRKKHEHSS